MITIKDVSRKAGVSIATVSRVLNGNGRVSDVTRARVKAVIEELEYTPHFSAQTLASNKTNTIGMITAWFEGPFYGPVLSGVEEELHRQGKHLIIASGRGDLAHERGAVQSMLSRKVDGLILVTEHLDDEYLLKLNKDIPIYLLNQHRKPLLDRTVQLDNIEGGYLATSHLIEHGHENIICVSGHKYKQDAVQRVAGFKKAMKAHRLQVSAKHYTYESFHKDGGYKAIKKIHSSGIEFSAVFAGSDEMVLGVYQWAKEQKLRIPRDLSVIGFDDHIVSQYTTPTISSLNYPANEMAKACAKMAVEEIYQGIKPHGIVYKPNLVVRKSVAKY